MLLVTHSLFKDKTSPFILITLFIRVIPIILLTIIDILILKHSITFFKLLGIILIIGGLLIVEL